MYTLHFSVPTDLLRISTAAIFNLFHIMACLESTKIVNANYQVFLPLPRDTMLLVRAQIPQ